MEISSSVGNLAAASAFVGQSANVNTSNEESTETVDNASEERAESVNTSAAARGNVQQANEVLPATPPATSAAQEGNTVQTQNPAPNPNPNTGNQVNITI